METTPSTFDKILKTTQRLSYPLVLLMATVSGDMRNVVRPTITQDVLQEKEIAKPTCIDTLKDGDDLLNRALCITSTDDAENGNVPFMIRKDAKGIYIEIQNARYRSTTAIVNKSISTVTLKKDDESCCVVLDAGLCGTAVITSRELGHVIAALSQKCGINDVFVDATVKKGCLARMLPDDLFEKTEKNGKHGYSITFVSDTVSDEQIAQLRW